MSEERRGCFGCGCAPVTGGGVGIGAILAMIISWSTYHSVLWAIIHGLLGWFYILYWLLTR